MNFNQVIEKLCDGKAYDFGHANLAGHFYKAPFPSQDTQTELDGAYSAITFWEHNRPAMPVLMLYDFDKDARWYCREATVHPSQR